MIIIPTEVAAEEENEIFLHLCPHLDMIAIIDLLNLILTEMIHIIITEDVQLLDMMIDTEKDHHTGLEQKKHQQRKGTQKETEREKDPDQERAVQVQNDGKERTDQPEEKINRLFIHQNVTWISFGSAKRRYLKTSTAVHSFVSGDVSD